MSRSWIQRVPQRVQGDGGQGEMARQVPRPPRPPVGVQAVQRLAMASLVAMKLSSSRRWRSAVRRPPAGRAWRPDRTRSGTGGLPVTAGGHRGGPEDVGGDQVADHVPGRPPRAPGRRRPLVGRRRSPGSRPGVGAGAGAGRPVSARRIEPEDRRALVPRVQSHGPPYRPGAPARRPHVGLSSARSARPSGRRASWREAVSSSVSTWIRLRGIRPQPDRSGAGSGVADLEMDVPGPRDLGPLGHDRGRTADPDGHDGGPGAGGQEGHSLVEVLDDRPGAALALGEQDQDLAGLEHLLGPAQGLPVGRLPVDGEGPDASAGSWPAAPFFQRLSLAM